MTRRALFQQLVEIQRAVARVIWMRFKNHPLDFAEQAHAPQGAQRLSYAREPLILADLAQLLSRHPVNRFILACSGCRNVRGRVSVSVSV